MVKSDIKSLNHLLGNIDIYLLDQILKGRFEGGLNILDAGCGEGRNLIYFVKNNYQVYGLDKDGDYIQMLKYLIKSINKEYPLDRFVTGSVEQMPYNDHKFDAVISSAVIHFAEDKEQFMKMMGEMVRVLKPNGTLFLRMAADVGMKKQLKPMGKGRYFLPDGSVRFLLTKELLAEFMDIYGFSFMEPFKTVIVDDKRCMSTLVLRKD